MFSNRYLEIILFQKNISFILLQFVQYGTKMQGPESNQGYKACPKKQLFYILQRKKIPQKAKEPN